MNLRNIRRLSCMERIVSSPETVLLIVLSVESSSQILINSNKALSVVEGGVGLGDLWVKGVDLLWWWVGSLNSGVSSWLSRELNVLSEVEFVTFHGDVFTEI